MAVMVVALGSIAFSQAKPGGIAREAAMGGSQAGTGLVLNPFIMDDPSMMLINPAYQSMYRDYGWANIAGGAMTGLSATGGQVGDDGYGHQSAGVAFSLNSDWNVGAILSYDPSAVNFVSSILGSSGIMQRASQNIPPVVNTWEAVLSHHASSLDWGLGIMYGHSNSDSKTNTPTTSSDNTASASLWGFRAGIVNDMGGGSSFDASAALRLDKATDNRMSTPTSPGSGGEYSASATELQFNARGKFHVSNKFNFVPYGMFLNISAEPKEDTPPTGATAVNGSAKATVTAYAIGAGGEYRSGGLYLAGGMSWQTAQLKLEASQTTPQASSTQTLKYTAIPVVNVGGEWWFLDWLAGRMGYYRSLGSVSLKNESSNASGSTSGEGSSTGNFVTIPGFGSFTFPLSGVNSSVAVGALSPNNWDGLITLGVGMKFGGFALDATVSEEALRRGFGLVGAQDNINTFGFMSASYYFGE
jgi:hypothetical protein